MRKHKDNKLVRRYEFSGFDEAWEFLGKVATLAKAHNHHPEIYNCYNMVELKLSTHDAGDIVTEKDRKLAEEIDKVS